MTGPAAGGTSPDKTASPSPGEPKQALSGGGSNVQAGSSQGGSRSGAETPAAPQGGVTPEAAASPAAEDRSFVAPDGETGVARQASDAVNNTGEPDPMADRAEIERAPGDDVDAATG